MYKLIAVDLDGTLLNQYGEVSIETKKTTKKIIENGTDIIIASGRPIDSIKTIASEIGSENYFIAGNGAIIYDIKNDEIIYKKTLSKRKLLKIIRICEENSISYNVYTDKTILSTSLEYNVLYYYKENLKKDENKKTNINIVKDMEEYIKNTEEENFIKITICDKNKSVFNAILKKIKKIKGIEFLEVSHMSRKMIKHGTEDIPIEYYYTEISLANVDKWNAIEYLMKKINIDRQDVIAIGDNINDRKMIENAGLGIAMKGSVMQDFEGANDVAPANFEDGVSKILQKYYKNINFS